MMNRDEYLAGETRTAAEIASDAAERIDACQADLTAGYAIDALNPLYAAMRDLEALEIAAIDAARADGWTWQQIGDYLGISRQSAHEKFARFCKSPSGD